MPLVKLRGGQQQEAKRKQLNQQLKEEYCQTTKKKVRKADHSEVI